MNYCILLWSYIIYLEQLILNTVSLGDRKWPYLDMMCLVSFSIWTLRLRPSFVDKLHADYNPCLTLVWDSLTSYTQISIHVLLWYEVFFLHFLSLWNTIQNSIVSDVLYFILFVRKINHTVFTDINVVLWIPLIGWAWAHQTR